jgi:hypothetical protein
LAALTGIIAMLKAKTTATAITKGNLFMCSFPPFNSAPWDISGAECENSRNPMADKSSIT